MKKLIFLLLTAFIFQANAQDKILKKMGANKKFYISQKEIIDLEKSFTVQNIVLDSDPIYYSSNSLFGSINEFLKNNSTVIDMVLKMESPFMFQTIQQLWVYLVLKSTEQVKKFYTYLLTALKVKVGEKE